ncbi:CLI_3235 family bacteriocin precursor [Paenibacillus thiaminolyticus]|uniref:Putative bacteriocin n=1 Tax=Paenibacillus thiaminolyticus TaxID=49283 RepID=A0A3A3GVT3_PANTH|nr:putative bacteriocin precursor [Paenibacillus thiaminolyticus]
MRKLGKKTDIMQETLEAYAACSCTSCACYNCTCSQTNSSALNYARYLQTYNSFYTISALS